MALSPLTQRLRSLCLRADLARSDTTDKRGQVVVVQRNEVGRRPGRDQVFMYEGRERRALGDARELT